MINLQRFGLATAIALLTMNIWTGAPLLAVWIGSRVQGTQGASMSALFVVIAVLAGTCIAIVWATSRLSERYDRITGRKAQRRVQPWMRSMRGERESKEDQAARLTDVERVLIVVVGFGVIAFEIWFFLFSGSSIGTA